MLRMACHLHASTLRCLQVLARLPCYRAGMHAFLMRVCEFHCGGVSWSTSSDRSGRASIACQPSEPKLRSVAGRRVAGRFHRQS